VLFDDPVELLLVLLVIVVLLVVVTFNLTVIRKEYVLVSGGVPLSVKVTVML
jgi:competence protein ComGC